MRDTVPLWFAVKLFVSAVTMLALRLRGNRFLQDHGYVNEAGPQLHGSFWAGLEHYDTTYYADIARSGYFGPGVTPVHQAFFPGYPLVVRAVAEVGGGVDTLPVAMWITSALASLAAAVVLWRLVAERHPGAQRWAVLLFLTGPYAVYLNAGYSEALFVALALAAWYQGHRDHWGRAAGFAAAAGFTRSNGLFLVAGLVAMYVIHSRRDGRRLLRPTLLWLPVSLLGVGAYFGYLWHRTGDPFAWNTAQTRGWGRHTGPPWDALRRSVELVPSVTEWDLRAQYVLDVVFAVGLLLAILVLARRRWWPETVYVATSWWALVTSTTFQSIGRNSLTMFPVPLLLADGLRRRPRTVRVAVGVVWFGLFCYNLFSFALGGWTD